MSSRDSKLYQALEEDEDFDAVISKTLRALEWRLRRLEFAITGEYETKESEESAAAITRIEHVEESLKKLASKNSVVLESLQLLTKYPELFNDASPKELPDGLEPSAALAMVLAKESEYPATASQLNELNDTPIPPTESFASWINLWPQVTAAQQRQYDQGVERHLLKLRSELLLQRYHEVFVEAQGLVWDEWEMRINQGKRTVRRREAKLEQDSK